MLRNLIFKSHKLLYVRRTNGRLFMYSKFKKNIYIMAEKWYNIIDHDFLRIRKNTDTPFNGE